MRQPRSALRRSISLLMAVALVAVLVSAGIATTIAGPVQTPAFVSGAPAAFVPPTSTQFDVTGFLQAASLDSTCTADAHCGGSLTVNGHVVVVPKETIVILPANALTWQELFAQAPAPYGLATVPPTTGMAVNDAPVPPYTYEVHVVGNRQGDTYIAGLIDIAQQGLNSGAGYINFIDYNTGEFRVGGTIGSSTTGQRVQLNDPTGRYGRIVTPDRRFTVDADNPTITAATGYPMCIPREDPTTVNADGTVGDVLCPQGNRPGDGTGNFAISIQTNDPRVPCTDPPTNSIPAGCSATGVGPDVFPRAKDQAPMEVGDYVTYAGTLIDDNNGSYVSAHTVTNNTAVYTWPGTNPAYVLTDTTLIGTGGLTVIGATEAVIRTRFEGMTTDPSRGIHLYGIDLDPITGATTDRDWGTIGVDPGPPNGAVKGRWRFRPPCAPFGTVVTKPDKQCVMNAANTFLPPTREMRAVIEGLQGQNPASPTATTSANGLFFGQYHAPILEYIFPENVPGSPIIPNNFEAIDFLACGGYTSAAGTIARQLNPWPGTVAPTCANAATAPVATVGANQVVASGAAVTLTGSATGNPAPTLAWSQAATDVPQVTLTGATTTSATFTAPTVAATTVLNFTLTATNSAGTGSASMTVTVNPPVGPVANAGPNQTVPSGSAVTLSGSATGATPITFSWAQATTDATQVVLTGAGTATATFTAPFVAVSTVLNFTLTATNTVGSSTASMTVTVNAATAPTVNPIPNVTIVSGAKGSFTVSGSDPNVPSALPLNFTATQSGTPALVSLSTNQGPNPPGTGATVNFQAPTLPVAQTTSSVITVSVTAKNKANVVSAPQTMTITVLPAQAPTVNAISPITVSSGAAGAFTVSGADPNLPASLPLLFTATQTGTPALVGLSVSQGPNPPGTAATVKFTAPTLPVGQVTSSTVTVSVTATNNAGKVSAPVTVTVTIKPLADIVTIQTAVYRIGKQRLDMTATSSVISPNVTLTLQPYITTAGTLFTPSSATFTNAGNGNYTLTLVGAPRPAAGPSLTVKSNLGGVGTSALTLVRQ